MAIERERKFLVKYIPDEATAYGSIKQQITQGYLMLDYGQHLRVRVIDGEKSYIAFKKDVAPGVKYEFEYEIPVQDAIILLDESPYRVNKTRYTFKHNSLEIELDEYPDGLLIAEIEFKNIHPFTDFIKQLDNLPDYFDRDVTGVGKYSNVQISINNSGEVPKYPHNDSV